MQNSPHVGSSNASRFNILSPFSSKSSSHFPPKTSNKNLFFLTKFWNQKHSKFQTIESNIPKYGTNKPVEENKLLHSKIHINKS